MSRFPSVVVIRVSALCLPFLLTCWFGCAPYLKDTCGCFLDVSSMPLAHISAVPCCGPTHSSMLEEHLPSHTLLLDAGLHVDHISVTALRELLRADLDSLLQASQQSLLQQVKLLLFQTYWCPTETADAVARGEIPCEPEQVEIPFVQLLSFPQAEPSVAASTNGKGRREGREHG